jgi:hypothetical protein
MWILRFIGVAMAACAAWVVVGSINTTAITRASMVIIEVIAGLAYLVCFIMGTSAVVMIFIKDSNWLYEHMYQPYLAPWITMSVFSLAPIAFFLTIFRKTRALGGFALYQLSIFLGFSLWFYSLIIAGLHGLGWVIGGLLMAGIGVIISAVLSSAVWGQWSIAGSIFFYAVLLSGAAWFGLHFAERQLEKDQDAKGVAWLHELVDRR